MTSPAAGRQHALHAPKEPLCFSTKAILLLHTGVAMTSLRRTRTNYMIVKYEIHRYYIIQTKITALVLHRASHLTKHAQLNSHIAYNKPDYQAMVHCSLQFNWPIAGSLNHLNYIISVFSHRLPFLSQSTFIESHMELYTVPVCTIVQLWNTVNSGCQVHLAVKHMLFVRRIFPCRYQTLFIRCIHGDHELCLYQQNGAIRLFASLVIVFATCMLDSHRHNSWAWSQ